MRFEPNDRIFGDYRIPQAGFQSAMNSMDFIKREGILSITEKDAGTLSRQQSMNLASISQLTMAVQTQFAGIRGEWDGAYNKIFQSFSFPSSTDPAALESAALQSLIGIGMNFVSAVPVVGQILGAAVAIGKLIAGLVKGRDEGDTGKIERFQRLLTYSRDTDQDSVNNYIWPRLEGYDWTPMFMPTMSGDWMILQAVDENDKKIAGKKVWRRDRYITGSDGRPNLGFVPGTQRQTELIQVGPGTRGLDEISYHEITDTGSLYPSVSQFCTFLWEAVNREGNPDMFKVNTDRLHAAWKEYYESAQYFARELIRTPDYMWVSAGMCPLTAWKSESGLLIGKDIPKDDKWPGCYWGPNTWGSAAKPKYGAGAAIMQLSVYDAVIKEALDTLFSRQIDALERDVVCAYVRWQQAKIKDGPYLPAFAAFKGDGPNAKALRAKCQEVRQILPGHQARFKVHAVDSDSVDFEYSKKLRQAGVPDVPRLGSFTVTARMPGAQKPAPPDSKGPQGGAPFAIAAAEEVVPPGKKKKPGGGGILLIGAAGALLYGIGRK